MKYTFLSFFFGLLLLVNCNDTNNEITAENVAKGKVAGSDWEFGGGKALSRLQTNDFELTLMSTVENAASDPCAVVVPNNAYINMNVIPAMGNYSVSSDANGVKFFAGGNATSFLTATSGFIQITAVSSFDIEGFLQANFDDQNNVEGYFLVAICN